MKNFITLHKFGDDNIREVYVAIAHIIQFWANDRGSYVSMSDDNYLYATESPNEIKQLIANATYQQENR